MTIEITLHWNETTRKNGCNALDMRYSALIIAVPFGFASAVDVDFVDEHISSYTPIWLYLIQSHV